jgi:hypothetical protein
MRIIAGMIVALSLLSGAAYAADADDGTAGDTPAVAALDDAAFDAQFQCPETFADKDGRIDELERYQAWAREQHPDWNLRKRLDVRYGLLRRHACAVTLANVALSAQPPFGR